MLAGSRSHRSDLESAFEMRASQNRGTIHKRNNSYGRFFMVLRVCEFTVERGNTGEGGDVRCLETMA
jgi:hypothetical protein